MSICYCKAHPWTYGKQTNLILNIFKPLQLPQKEKVAVGGSVLGVKKVSDVLGRHWRLMDTEHVAEKVFS